MTEPNSTASLAIEPLPGIDASPVEWAAIGADLARIADSLPRYDENTEWTCQYHNRRVGWPCGETTNRGKPCRQTPANLVKRASRQFLEMARSRLPDSTADDAKSTKAATYPDPTGRTSYHQLKLRLWHKLAEHEHDGNRRVCPVPDCQLAKYYEDFQLDHKEPLSKGGLDIDANIQIMCGACNRRKSWLPEAAAFPDALFDKAGEPATAAVSLNQIFS